MLGYAWIIPLLTFSSFWLILFFGKRLPFKGAEVGIFALAVSFFFSLALAGAWIGRDATQTVTHGRTTIETGSAEAPGVGRSSEVTSAPGEHAGGPEEETVKIRPAVDKSFTWWEIGDVKVEAGIHVDGFAIAMLVVVSAISFLVHIFSTSYMHGDERFVHYYAGLSLFTTGMFVLVTASNTLQALFGWELMGLCSFMLIGHWWEDYPNARAALKAFFTTRTGDVGLLVGISILFFGAGQTFDMERTNQLALSGAISHTVLLVAASALLVAVIGKSAQFPLHTWLPDAMAGPTPVSALIHAATMVVAGVYLVARLYAVFWRGFSIAAGGFNVLALVGAVTLVIAAALAFVQTDIKKVLAYSTVSQLGYMVMGLGVGAWTAAIFHLFTHAFFKACLFLGAGSISHSGSHHSFDMVEDMGGLRKYMPYTFWTFLIATGALMGLPPLAGFWSKDEILLGAGKNGYDAFMIVGLIGAAMTAAYMTRAVYLTFFGERRGGALHHTPHESPASIVAPLIALAGLSIGAGFFNAPFLDTPFAHWTNNTTVISAGVAEHGFELLAAAISVLAGLAGIAVAYAYFWRGFRLRSLRHNQGPTGAVYRFLVNKYYLDKLYEGVIVAGITGPVARGAYWVNQKVIDGVVNGAGLAARGVARFVYEVVDQGVVDGIVNGAGFVSEEAGAGLRYTQSGRVQSYAALMLGAVAIFGLALVIL